MKIFKKFFTFLTRTLAGKFTIFILGLVMIIISLLIWFNFRGSMNIVNNQNKSFIGNSENLINKNFKYTIDQIDTLLNKQFTETTELLKNNLTQATMEKGKAIITNLSGQLGNAISNYDFGFGVTAFNEIFKNDNTVVYAALIDNQKSAMFYKTSIYFTEKKKKSGDETYYKNSEFEGKNISDGLVDKSFKTKKIQGEDYLDAKFKINIYKIVQPIVINNELWGVVVLGFSLENLYKEIDTMQANFKQKIVLEKNRLQEESIKQKTEEIDKIKQNLIVIQKNIKNDVKENAYYYFIGFSIPGLILAFLFGKNIAKPIISMVPALQKISKGILTEKIKMRRNDEIKILGDGIDTMVDELNNIISTINGIIKSITNENHNLLNFSRHTTTTIDTISGNINEIEVGVLNNSMDVNATADRLKRFVDTLGQMTQNVVTLNQNAKTTENVTTEGKDSFNNLLSKMENIEDGFKQTDALVTELNKFSFEIKDIIKVIEDIATRTRMLAYSVNVIAQKGGQQDKSITNIAVEVRNLSKFISDYSSNIMKLMDNNNVLIEKIFNSTKAGLKNIESGIMTSNILMNSMNEIVEKVNTDKVMINDISNMISDIDKESKTIFASTENISQVTSQMSNLITSTAKAIYEERETIKQLNISVNKLKDIADSLRIKMQDFTINE